MVMAARRQQPAPAATPPGLKVKLKTGGAGPKPSKESGPEESGEDIGAEPGDSPISKERMLKRKRPSPSASPTPNKRSPREESPVPLEANGDPVEVVPGKSQIIVADCKVVQQRVGLSHTSVGAILQAEQAVQVGTDKDNEEGKKVTPSLENISHGQLLVNPAPTADQHGFSAAGKRAGADPSGFGDKSQLVVTGVQSSSSLATPGPRTPNGAKRQHTIPSHSGWFSWTKIHTLEKRGMPEFFNGKTPGKTPELYMEYRNIIIRKYREELEHVITVADVQELLRGADEKTSSRILEFLDHWGLINYQAPADLIPVWKSPAPTLEADAAGMLRALPQKGSSLYNFDRRPAPVPKETPGNLRSADALNSETLTLPEGPEVEYHCNSCAADCSKQRYHCQKQADFDLCPDCYNDGKFGPHMVCTDFLKMDANEVADANGGGWTDQETLLLLEALEIYGDNWNEIAEHVATKSKAQCILHFIKLPVEDPFLEDMETPGTSLTAPTPPPQSQVDSTHQGEQTGEEVPDKAHESSSASTPTTKAGVGDSNGSVVHLPSFVAFADAGNPVMAQVAFLAAMVGPRVAAAAAQAALATLTEKDPGPILAAGTAIIAEKPNAASQRSSSALQPQRVLKAEGELGIGEKGTQTVPVTESNISAMKNEIGHPDTGKDSVLKLKADGRLSILEETISADRVKQAAASAMAAAAIKAKLLADQEEREMQRLVTIVIEYQLKKLELKLKTFSDLETMLVKESESVERARQKIYGEHARMVATRLGTSSSPNPPTPVPGHQIPATAQRPAGYTYAPGGQATPISGSHAPGASSSSQVPNSIGSGPARPVTAGTMSTAQGQFVRQSMVGGATPPPSVGRPVMPQGATPSPQVLGRPSIPSPNTPAHGLGRPLTAPPGMSRPAPGGTSSGVTQ